jgi:hypothetical protein
MGNRTIASLQLSAGGIKSKGHAQGSNVGHSPQASALLAGEIARDQGFELARFTPRPFGTILMQISAVSVRAADPASHAWPSMSRLRRPRLVAGRDRIEDDGVEAFRDAVGDRTVVVVDHGDRRCGDRCGRCSSGRTVMDRLFCGERAG